MTFVRRAATELREAVGGLPAGQRRALTLTKLEGLSLAEASARSGLSADALKVATHRAVRTLRARLGLREVLAPSLGGVFGCTLYRREAMVDLRSENGCLRHMDNSRRLDQRSPADLGSQIEDNGVRWAMRAQRFLVKYSDECSQDRQFQRTTDHRGECEEGCSGTVPGEAEAG